MAVICTGVAWLAPARSAAQTTYHVSPTGNDANPGTQAQPFATIQRAANTVDPGDTVVVASGTYRGVGTGTPCASGGDRPVVCIWRSGTSTAWVTFRSSPPGGAKIDGAANSSTYGFQFTDGVGYIRVEGFDVFGMGSTSHDVSGFVLYSGGHDVVLAGNDIHHIGRLCTDHVYGMSAIYIHNARVTVTGNRIHDIGRFAPGEQGCSPSSGNYQNHDHGVYINGTVDEWAAPARDVVVSNNLFWNIARGWPMQVYPGIVANLSILHNTFAYPNPYRAGHIIIYASTTNARILNNVFLDPTTAAINFSAGTQVGMRVANNVTSRAIANRTQAGVTFADNLEAVDPQLMPGTMRPTAASPAIDAGMTLAEVNVDIGWVARPQGFNSDAGAWEFEVNLPGPPILLPLLPITTGGRGP